VRKFSPPAQLCTAFPTIRDFKSNSAFPVAKPLHLSNFAHLPF
jgi:hypothetical protein